MGCKPNIMINDRQCLCNVDYIHRNIHTARGGHNSTWQRGSISSHFCFTPCCQTGNCYIEQCLPEMTLHSLNRFTNSFSRKSSLELENFYIGLFQPTNIRINFRGLKSKNCFSLTCLSTRKLKLNAQKNDSLHISTSCLDFWSFSMSQANLSIIVTPQRNLR